MHTKATHTDIKNANEKLHRIPESHGQLTIRTFSLLIEFDEWYITIYDCAGSRIIIDVSGREDRRRIDDIIIEVDEFGTVDVVMPAPYHQISFPLSSIIGISWAYPHEEGWSGWDIFKREKI
jgi:hypothetical protein